MKKTSRSPQAFSANAGYYILRFLMLAAGFLAIELLALLLLKPAEGIAAVFGVLWAVLLAGILALLPRRICRVSFGILYYILLIWTLMQCGYYQVFGKLMWLSTLFYAGEASTFVWDTVLALPTLWWVGAVCLVLLGVGLLWLFPKQENPFPYRLPGVLLSAAAIVTLCFLPELAFQRDNEVWGTRSEYGQSSSYRAAYNTMYDARKVYDLCGMYQLLMRDIWVHNLYPLTPGYRSAQQAQTERVEDYFAQRAPHQDNDMTGIFAGKNVVLVLMESMDDWMITQADTPTIHRLMDEGIQFTDFYTPGYGSARTLNTEFCMNTGMYLPTTGRYVFDYVTNDYSQSMANQFTDQGYSAEVFHYNDPAFYSRGVFEPVMGYGSYNCYADYTDDKNALYSDTLLFEIPQLKEKFFRQGPTFNTIITRSAHLSYKYNEVLSHYGLKQYPAYRGLYASEEEDCARLKARLVDDLFTRLLQELEAAGQLENTVIIGITDHYTYGYKNTQELYDLSGVNEELLLEKTPCFIWSADAPSMTVDKTLNTADLLPTVLNLMGIDSPYTYLGQDAFDPNYTGFAIFPDGSWISNGVACRYDPTGQPVILLNEPDQALTETQLLSMQEVAHIYIRISNLLLTSDYYQPE